MKKALLHFTSPLLVLAMTLSASGRPAQLSKPNIILILADDLGYGDLQCLNPVGKIKTPSLDRIAASGLRFTDAHSPSAVCTPTRYAMLTGRYAWRTRLKRNVLVPYDPPLIDSGRTTIADMLKADGYHTAAFGKWHLGMNWPTRDGRKPRDTDTSNNIAYDVAITGGPLDHGFGYFFGMDAPNYPPYAFMENRRLLGAPTRFYRKHPYNDCRQGTGVEGWDLQGIMPELQKRTIAYLDDPARKGNPFFLYLPLTAPHTPIAPAEAFTGVSGLNTYADFVMQVDGYVGAVLDALERNGLAENTLVVFTSDNGCSPEAGFKRLAQLGHDPNAGFRGHKADLFEGGHRVPLLMQWPSQLPANRIVRQTVCLSDLMATFASINGIALQEDEAEDSFDLLPLMRNPDRRTRIREATVHHSYLGDFAIRKGRWKLLLTPGSGGWSFPVKPEDLKGLPEIQLYDIEQDPVEKVNRETRHPKVVRRLKGLLEEYMQEGRSTPKPVQRQTTGLMK